jgi:GNAT superfamily N-acetyltransferase
MCGAGAACRLAAVPPTYTFGHADDARLPEYYRLNSLEDVQLALERARPRLESGQLSYEMLRTMRSERGLEAAWLQGGGPVVFPRVRLDLDTAGQAALVAELTRTLGNTRLILDERLAPLDDAPWRAAGWRLDNHAVMYQTDLSAGRWPRDPRVQERPLNGALAPGLQALYAALLAQDGQLGDFSERDPDAALAETIEDGEARLFVLLDGEEALGAALLTRTPREANIQLLGVQPARRGQGLGRALHAHLLAVAAETQTQHGGGTDFGNRAMQRVFAASGSTRLGEQRQYIRP